MESGASVRNLTVEGEVIPAGTQTDVGGIVGQMVPDITLRFSSGGLDELQTELNALQSLINRTPDTAQLRADIGVLQAADGVPEELLHLTLRFVARGKVLKRQTFGYGDSFTADDFPEAPKKDGCYADWNVTDLSDLRFDTTVTALAAGDTEDGRPALLAEGLFRTGDTLQAVQADTADAPRGAAGVWTLTLPAIAAVITLVIRKRRARAAKRAINIARPLCLWQSGRAVFFQKDFALLDELICFGSGSVSAFPPCRRTGQASGYGQNCGHRSCAPRADPCPHP